MARDSADNYAAALAEFNASILNASTILGNSGRIFFFSDCAFVEANRPAKLISFLTEMRTSLMQKSLFFRGAVMNQALNPVDVSECPTISKDVQLRAFVKKSVHGHYFGKGAAELVGREERLRGIAIWVENVTANNTVQTCHIPDLRYRTAEAFWDIKLTDRDLTRETLHVVLTEFYRAKMLSKKLGRYYIPLLVLWINSCCYDNIDDISISGDDHLVSIMINGSLERLFGDVVGIEQVYFALIEKMVDERIQFSPRIARAVWAYLETHRSIINHVEYAPEEILSSGARDLVLRRFTSRVLRVSDEYRNSLEIIRNARAAEMSDGEIAKQLGNRGLTNKDGRRWTSSGVRAIRNREGIE